ncbi:hypothetical protein PHMEG_0004532 [Phytophthora megakarya]|uniref:Uncharacterized protein n=1 Tax=Phytophthora megakarya TaxID=4795 RepID=A0A225WTN8_9STRA|nr:hypothetical protein PHMEG_0004532 [Phytophthora megakarya]
MENLLEMRPALWNMMKPGARKRSRRIDVPPGEMKHMAELIFQQLSLGVNVAYHNVEIVDNAVSSILEKLPPGEPLLRSINGKRAEAFASNIVPFGMVETSNAWWQYWSNHRGQVNSDDVVTESFGLEIIDAKTNVSATFYIQQILRRHVEDHRIVFVWSGYIEPFLFKGNRIRGVYYNEHSYVLIKPRTCEGEAITTLSSCETMTPQFLDPELRKDSTVVELTKFLVSSMPSDILTWNEVVENLLLDQMLQRR